MLTEKELGDNYEYYKNLGETVEANRLLLKEHEEIERLQPKSIIRRRWVFLSFIITCFFATFCYDFFDNRLIYWAILFYMFCFSVTLAIVNWEVPDKDDEEPVQEHSDYITLN